MEGILGVERPFAEDRKITPLVEEEQPEVSPMIIEAEPEKEKVRTG